MNAEDILNKYWGHVAFRGQQLDVIDRVMADRHALVIMPTGMGKSICFQIPALLHAQQHGDGPKGLVLVVSPLIALMKDQVDALVRKGISAAYINSSLSRKEREAGYTAVSEGQYALLYVTPERFRKPEFVEVIGKRDIRLLAVDEAHCISEWGHDFRPDYTRLEEFRGLVGNPTTIALTATATPDVQRDIVRQLGLTADNVKLFHEGIDRPNLQLLVEQVWGQDEKQEHILEIARRPELQGGSGIVYFTLIKTLMQFSDRLRQAGLPHVCYHGDLERTARRRIQNEFMQGECPLVLATNAFGMGIDKEDIRFVTHADLPGSMEAYYQEIGRAGRDGLASRCVLLYDESDLATQMEFMGWSNPDAEFYERVYDFLSQEMEQVRAFGMEWLREKLHFKDRFDHRLETVISMLDRYGVTEGDIEPRTLEVVTPLPAALSNKERLEEKLHRDQQKLFALLQYVKHEGDRKQYIHEYFGLPYAAVP